ncbi:MAG: tetratricopeptide repeat protein [Myxococcota bacterium]
MADHDGVMVLDGCRIDLRRAEVSTSQATHRLTPLEVKLLAYLGERSGEVVPSLELHVRVLGYAARVESAALGVAVRRLRRKLGSGAALQTVRGVGYQLLVERFEARDDQRFVGRTAELRALLDTDAPLVALVGPPGVGKTRLAQELGRAWRGYSWFVPVAHRTTLDDIAAAFAQALDVPPPLRDPSGWLSRVIRRRSDTLWIVDDAEGVIDVVGPLLGLLANDLPRRSRLVVTTRVAPASGACHPVEPLAVEHAVELMVVEARRDNPGFTFDDRHASSLTALVEALDRLPLAIVLAAAQLGVLSLDQLAARLGLALLRAADEHDPRHASLEAAILVSYQLLAPAEQAAFRRCAVFRGGVTPGTLVSDQALDALERASLVTRVSAVDPDLPPRYELLPLLAAFADRQLADGERAAAELEHGRAFAASVSEDDPEDGIMGRPVSAAPLANLVVACNRAIARGDGDVATATALGAWRIYRTRGPISSGGDLLLAAADVPGTSPRRRAVLLLDAAVARRVVGRLQEAEALYRDALASFERLGDRGDAARATRGLGYLAARRGDQDEARHHLHGALAIHRELGDESDEGAALLALAQLALGRGAFADARDDCIAALAIAQRIGARQIEAGVLTNLATLEDGAGRTDAAFELYYAALAVYEETEDRTGRAFTLNNVALLHHRIGHTSAAQTYFEAALSLLRELGDAASEATSLGNLAMVHMQRGRPEAAFDCGARALAIHRELGNRYPQGNQLANMANACASATGSWLGPPDPVRAEQALALFDEALAVLREVGNHSGEGIALANLGELEVRLGRLDDARTHLDAGVAIDQRLGNRYAEGVAWGVLGTLMARWGRTDDALASLDRGEALLRDLNSHGELGKLLCRRAHAALIAGDSEAARAVFARAAALAAEPEFGPQSELGQWIAALELALQRAAP